MRFLYATDGSEGSKAGAEFLRSLPLTPEDEIALLTVTQAEEGKGEGQRILDQAKAWLGETPARLHRYVRTGNAALEIIDAIVWLAEEVPTDLVVVGTQGRTGIARFFLGSVAERVARFAPRPVVVASHVDSPVRSVVIGFDGSRGARRCVEFVDRLPLEPDCEICVAAITTPVTATGFLPGRIKSELESVCREERAAARRGLDEMTKQLEASGRKVTTFLEDGDPASWLLRLADERKADLLVVGAQGVSEVEQFLMGSVSDKVLRHAKTSVLVVRPLPGEE
jgi:nucleotide-binding universal stress UspA family protein